MSVYYSEHDPLKAEVLREAIKAGAIAPGDVDERSIVDVRASDLVGYTQCHFFAGGGFWSLALRRAGVPDWWPCWTGSCPCPSFSAAGKGGGFDDPRHLWPVWGKLIAECKPPVVFGEQADDAVGYGWLDLVQTDLEAQAYAVGKIVFGACSVGAPHIRQRLYFCADTARDGRQHESAVGVFDGTGDSSRKSGVEFGDRCASGIRADSDGGQSGDGDLQCGGEQRLLAQDCGTGVVGNTEERRDGARNGKSRSSDGPKVAVGGSSVPLCGDDTFGLGRGARRNDDASNERQQSNAAREPVGGPDAHNAERRPEGTGWDVREWRGPGWLDPDAARSIAEAGATRGDWRDCDWWYGRDGKFRPIGPGLSPLAYGSPARMGRLRLYGDAIVVAQAQAFIEAYCEARGIRHDL